MPGFLLISWTAPSHSSLVVPPHLPDLLTLERTRAIVELFVSISTHNLGVLNQAYSFKYYPHTNNSQMILAQAWTPKLQTDSLFPTQHLLNI